jgi:hypothetical protein
MRPKMRDTSPKLALMLILAKLLREAAVVDRLSGRNVKKVGLLAACQGTGAGNYLKQRT